MNPDDAERAKRVLQKKIPEAVEKALRNLRPLSRRELQRRKLLSQIADRLRAERPTTWS